MFCKVWAKWGGHLPVAVDHEDVLGLWLLEAADPLEQVVPVGVGAEAVEPDDPRPDGDLLAEQLHPLGPVQNPAAQRALRLVAHKQDGGLRPPQVVLQMVADSPRLAHAARRDNYLGRHVKVDFLGLLTCDGKLEPREIRGD